MHMLKIMMITALLNVMPNFINSSESGVYPAVSTEALREGGSLVEGEDRQEAPTIDEHAEQHPVVQPAAEETHHEEATPEHEVANMPVAEPTPEEPAISLEAFMPKSTPSTPQTLSQQAPANLPTEETTFTIPAEPEPAADEIVEIPEFSPEEEPQPMGIDTVSLENPQGNWLWKRIWWERAEERYEKIRTLVDAIWDSRTEFFVKRNELDRNILRPFYLNVGLEQGELQAILAEIIDFIEKKREQQGDLNEQQRMLYESYATEEEALKQLKLNVEAIGNLDHEIDNALGTFMNQINRVRGFEEQAWQNFREIARILNDTKARELYYIIEGAARNIKNIDNYLKRDFLNHFNTLINEAAKHVSIVQKQIEALKEKGISFKRQTELLKEQEQVQQEEEEEEEVAPKPKLSWFGWIMSWFTGAFNMIVSLVKMPYNMIFGK